MALSLVHFIAANLLLIFGVSICCALCCGFCYYVFANDSKEEEYGASWWQKEENGQYSVPFYPTLWKIQSVLHEGSNRPSVFCVFDWFEGLLYPKFWDKLLGDLPGVCEPLIHEFYANVILWEDEINLLTPHFATRI